MKNGVDKLVSVYSTYNETSLLDQYITKENIKLETTNAIEACQRLTEITRRAINEADEVYVATDGEFIGSILNFVANKEDVNSIYYYFNNQIIHMPKLSLNMSKTKLKILETLHGLQTHQQPYGRRSGCSEKTIREILPHRRRKNAYNLIF